MTTSVYYAPKAPLSIPLFNPQNQCYTLIYDDYEVDVPADLFFKIFERKEVSKTESKPQSKTEKPSISELIKENYTQEEIDAETKKAHDEMVARVRAAKLFGMTREMFVDGIDTDPALKNLIKDDTTRTYYKMVTNQIWDEVESK